MFRLPVILLVTALCTAGLTRVVEAKTSSSNLYIVAEDFPPYGASQSLMKLYAYDYELVQRIFKELGFATRIAFLPWKRAMRDVQDLKAVGILSCAQTNERAKYLYFRTPINRYTNGFFSRRDRKLPPPQTLNDVKHYDIASVKGHTGMQQLRAAGLNPLVANDAKSALLMLEAGRFEYLYLNRELTFHEIQHRGLDALFTFTPIAVEDTYFCFNKHYPDIQEIMNGFEEKLQQFRKDGTLKSIQAKYK